MRIFSFFFALVLLSAGGAAVAQSQAVAVTYGPTGGTLTGGAITTAAPSDFTRLIQGGAVVGDVSIRDGATARVGSRDVAMVLDRKMPWQQIGRAAAVLGRTLPYVATAVAFIDLMDSFRLRSNGSDWKHDAGVPPTMGAGWAACPPYNGCAVARQIKGSTGYIAGEYARQLNVQEEAAPFYCVSNPGPKQSWSVGRIENEGTLKRQYFVSSCNGAEQSTLLYPEQQLSCAAGGTIGYDGKCSTGNYTDTKSVDEAAAMAEANGAKGTAAGVVGSMLGRGFDLAPYTNTPTASGPSSVAQPGTTTTTTGPNGTTTGTSTPTTVITYNGPSYVWNDSTVITTTNGGVTTTTTTVAPPPAEIQTCGLPGKPPCKIDETGTPSVIPPFSTTPIDATKSTDATKQDTEISRVVNPGFGWFSVPPMATCAPIAWPGGVQINPCNGIEVVRSIMAYLWALYGAVWSFGVFRRSLPGAA